MVSVIIPTHNRAEMVVKCVQSVLASEGVELEVVVADDCSTDDTRARIERIFGGEARVKYVRTERSGLAAAARNCGARAASGEYFFFLDDDNELMPDAIKELLECFRRNPRVRLVAPLAVQWHEDGRRTVWTLGSQFNPWTSRSREYFAPSTPLDEMPPAPVGKSDFPTTCSPNALMVRRETFLEVDGFDEGYGMQFEETDFGVKVTANDKNRGMICAKAITRHYGYRDHGEVVALRALGIGNVRRAYGLGCNRVKFARRHFAWYQALSVTLVFAPLSALWYCTVALKNGRPDIAWAYLKGTLAGILGLYGTKLYGGGR